jgi:hypothetical protein
MIRYPTNDPYPKRKGEKEGRSKADVGNKLTNSSPTLYEYELLQLIQTKAGRGSWQHSIIHMYAKSVYMKPLSHYVCICGAPAW